MTDVGRTNPGFDRDRASLPHGFSQTRRRPFGGDEGRTQYLQSVVIALHRLGIGDLQVQILCPTTDILDDSLLGQAEIVKSLESLAASFWRLRRVLPCFCRNATTHGADLDRRQQQCQWC